MAEIHAPSLYQINTRVWLTELSRVLGKHATLDDVADADLDCLAPLTISDASADVKNDLVDGDPHRHLY